VTDIGEYIRHRSCDRRFFLQVHKRGACKHPPFFDRLANTLDPVLKGVGRTRGDQWEGGIKRNRFPDLTETASKGKQASAPWKDFAGTLSSLPAGQPAYGRQIEVEGIIGAFLVKGVIDFVLLRWAEGLPRLCLVECKASRRDRTYHRVQVAVYRMLL